MRFGRGWYIVNSVAAIAPAQVLIYDEIGAGGVSASSLLADLGGASEVEIRVNSDGGDVFEAMTIANRLRSFRSVSVVVDGLAASAATIVCMAASPGKLGMAPGSMLMVHDAWAVAPQGNSAELQALAAVLDGVSDQISETYARRTGRPAAYWREQMRAETWLNARQAVAAGLADYVEGDVPGLNAAVAAAVRAQVLEAASYARIRAQLKRKGIRG